MTWQLQDVELNVAIHSMLEQGRDVHLFFRRVKTKMQAADSKLIDFFQSNQCDAEWGNGEKSRQLTGFPSMPGGPRSPKSPGKP